ncbi:unnamed protein product [Urochloa humidicola]
MMSSRASPAAAGGEGERRLQNVSVALPRPARPVPGAAGPRPGTPRPVVGLGPARCGGAAPSGRAECNWWGAGARQAAATPRRQRSCRGARPAARVPTGKGNRELVRARPGRAGRPGQEVELPAGAQPAAQRVVAVPCRLAAATAVVER